MPYPSLLDPEPLSLWQSSTDPYLHRRYSHTVLSQSLWGPCVLVHTRSQSILKEISPEYSLEGLMLKLKLQYFDHLMPRADSLEKTLMLGN